MKYDMTLTEKQNLTAYLISIATITIGGSVYNFAISYFLLNETGSALYFSINLAISSITFLIITPISGVLTDFLNRRNIIIYGEFILMLSILLLFIVTYFYGLSLFSIYIVTFIRSLFNAIVNNAFSASVSNMFHIDNLQKVLGLSSSIQSSATFLGPILGGLLFGISSFELVLFIFLLLSLISFLFDYSINFELFKKENISNNFITDSKINYFKKFLDEIKSGFKYLVSVPILSTVIFVGVFINFFNAGDMVLPEKMMINVLDFSPIQVGIVNGIMACGTVVAGIYLANTKKIENHLNVMRWGFIICAFITILIPIPIYLEKHFQFNFLYLSTILFIKFFVLALINVPFIRIIHEETEDYMKGRVFSGLGVISSAIIPIAFILYGFIYDLGFYFLPNIISAVIIILLSIIYFNPKKFI